MEIAGEDWRIDKYNEELAKLGLSCEIDDLYDDDDIESVDHSESGYSGFVRTNAFLVIKDEEKFKNAFAKELSIASV